LSIGHADRVCARHPGRRRRRAPPRHAHSLVRTRRPPRHRRPRRDGGARARRRAGLRRRAPRRRARRGPGRPRRRPRAASASRRRADHHAHRARQRGRRRAGPRGRRRRLRDEAVRPRRAAQPHPRRPAPRPGARRGGRRLRRSRDDRPARAAGHRDRVAGARDVLRVRGAVVPHGAARQALHPPGASGRAHERQRLPRPARDRRPHPPSAREARGEARGAEPHPHRARGGLPVSGAVRHILRRSGLRGRLLIALVATSALTLAVAAAALLPPLQERLRTQRVDDLQAATEADVPQFEAVLGRALHDYAREPESLRRTELVLRTQERATLLRQRTGARVVVTDAIPVRVYDTDTASALPASLLYSALINGDNLRAVTGSTVTVVAPLFPSPPPGNLLKSHPEYEHFLLITQRPLTDVDAAVAQVRRAFIAAAGIGLIVALVLGIGLSITLSRRLARLRAAAVRVAAEGPD